MKARDLQIFAWGSAGFAFLAGLFAWGQTFKWQFFMSNYTLFSLFGLVAFGLMWSHYVTAAVRQYFKLGKEITQNYFEITSLIVLTAILLHPGLLAYQLWRDGAGLPPASELHYLGPKKEVYILMAMISLCLFLAYELRRWFKDRSWWKYIQYLTDIAIVMIYIHALNVGGQLQQGWYRTVWYFYGITLAGSLGYIYYKKLAPTKEPNAQ